MMIKNGEIGDIQVVVAEYPQGWMATPVEQEGNKQAAWRTDPENPVSPTAWAISAPTLKTQSLTSPGWK